MAIMVPSLPPSTNHPFFPMSPKPLFAPLRSPLAVWLAVLIALLGAIAPAVSHALVLARGGASPMVEICTSTGPRWVASNIPAGSPNGQESAPALEHCPFCPLTTDRVAPPPHVLLYLFAVLSKPEAPTIRQVFFFATPLALAPPPRGPPSSF